MSEPVDPYAAQGPWQPADYQPPPPFAPPSATQPTPQPPPTPGSMWIMGPDGVFVPASPPQQPPTRRRRNLVIAVVAVVVLVAGAISAVLLLDDGGSSRDRLSIPASFDGYSQVTGTAARQVESTMRGMAGGNAISSDMFDAATIGSYAKDSGDQPRLILLVLPTSQVPAGAGGSPREIARGMLAIAGSGVSDYAAGRHGGSSACADTQFGSVAETMCAWADPTTTGLMVSVLTPMTPSDLSAIEQDFRDLVD